VAARAVCHRMENEAVIKAAFAKTVLVRAMSG